jgi:putative insertion element HTH domain-containing protein
MNRSISNKQKERAAQLVAEGRFSDAEIAAKVGVSANTIFNWKRKPRFAARVTEIVEQYRARVMKRGLALKANRIAGLTSLYNRLESLLDLRGSRGEFAFVPGYASGLLMISEVALLKGDQMGTRSGAGATPSAPQSQGEAAADPWAAAVLNGQSRIKFSVDHDTVREMREILDQVAEEMGEKITRTELSLPSRFEQMSDAELVALGRRLGVPIPSELAGPVIMMPRGLPAGDPE